MLSCALTCRALSDVALAELWRVLDYHVFLLKLLPWTTRDDSLFDEVIVRAFPHPAIYTLLTDGNRILKSISTNKPGRGFDGTRGMFMK